MIKRKTFMNIRAVYSPAVGAFVVLLPVVDCVDYCFSGISAKALLFVPLALLLIYAAIARQGYRWRGMDVWVGLFWGWGIIRYFTSDVPGDIFVLYGMLSMGMLYVWMRGCDGGRVLFPALLAGGVVQATWGVMQALEILPAGHRYFKATGSFDNPALWGIYLGVSFFGGVVLLCRQEEGFGRKLLVCAGLAVVAAGLVVARSRAAWVALACGLGWTYGVPHGVAWWRRQKKGSVVAGGVLLCLALLTVWGIYRIRPESVLGRWLIWQVACDMFGQAPWVGHGMASFCADYMLHQAAWFGRHPDSALAMVAGNNHFAFNEYLEILCERGIVGLVLSGGIVYGIFKNGGSDMARLYAGMAVVLLVAGLFSYPSKNMALLAVFCMALAGIAREGDGAVHLFAFPEKWRWAVVAVLAASTIPVAVSYGYRKSVGGDLLRVKSGELPLSEVSVSKTGGRLATSPEYVLWMAEELYKRQCYREAIPVLERACALYCNELVLTALGECYQKEKMYNRAEQAFLQAAQMTPAYILPRYHLFDLYRETGNVKAACRVAEKALVMQVKVVNTTVLRARHAMRTYVEQNKKGGG